MCFAQALKGQNIKPIMNYIFEHEETITAAGEEYRRRFQSHPNGGYLVTCAELPLMLAFDETLEEARAEAHEEIAAWIATAELSQTVMMTRV